MNHVKQESPAAYIDQDQAIIDRALAILESRFTRGSSAPLDSPAAVRQYLALKLAHLEREEFHVLFLDSQHRVIELVRHSIGTLTQTAVYPRDIAKEGLRLNAGACILAHNHPSGVPEPSRADEQITSQIKSVLSHFDIRVLDHIIVGGSKSVSLAERGLI